ncbi:MAG: cytochrome c peroxidase [Gammaproteobacteria bacterium]
MSPFARRAMLACVFAFSHAVHAWDALPAVAPAPPDNPTTPAKVTLGNALYFDTRLSADGTIACASCHVPAVGGDDGRRVSLGVGGAPGTRNAPTVLNAAFFSAQFWDGRAASLEAQALGPMVNPVEMGNLSHAEVTAMLESIAGYRPLFDAAFGAGTPITIENVAKAIAAFERTLLTPDSPFDRYVNGDTSALTATQIAGMNRFAGIGCTDCHAGAHFAGPPQPDGTPFLQRFPRYTTSSYVAQYDLLADTGRFQVTGVPSDRHKYKVPSLRNVALTAPYFHNGAVATLPEAVRVIAQVQLDLTLDDDAVAELVAFLEALTGELPAVEPVIVADDPPGTVQVPTLPLVAAGLLIAALLLIRHRLEA